MSKKLIIKTPITNANEDYTLKLPDKNSGEYTIAINEDVIHKTGDETNITGTKTLKGAAGEPSTAISNTGISISGNINGNSSSLTDAGLSVDTGGGAPITIYARGQIQQVDGSGMHPTLTYTLPSDSGKLATENYVDDAIAALPEPMIFKGSVGSGGTVEWENLPSAASSNKGFTYKVITDHATDPECQAGDTIISNGSAWVVIPSGDEPSGTVTNVDTAAAADSGLTLTGGPITSSGTITVGLDSGYSLLNSNSDQTINGNKTFQDWVTIESQYVSYPKLRLENEKIMVWPTSTGYWAGFGYGSNSTQPTIFINNDTSEGGYQIAIPYEDGTLATHETVNKHQRTTTVVRNERTNINGYVLSSYKATLETVSGYTVYHITRNSHECSTDDVANYMARMTGSYFIPTYDEDYPRDSVLIFADGSMWKPQYNNGVFNLYRLQDTYLNTVVMRTGDQTIEGVKTFAANTLKLTGDHGTITTVSGGTSGEQIAGLASSGNVIAQGKLISKASDNYAEYNQRNIVVGKAGGGGYTYTLTLPTKADGTIALTSDIPDVDDFVTGPSSSTTDCIALFSGGNGKALKNGPLKVTENSSTRTVTITSGAGSNYITLGPSSGSVTTLASFSATANIIGHASNTHDAFYGSGYNSLIDLGTSSNKWTDLYLSGSLKDGTNSITIAQLVAAQAILVCPTTTDGNYILRATVNNGAVTYEWVEDNFVRLS